MLREYPHPSEYPMPTVNQSQVGQSLNTVPMMDVDNVNHPSHYTSRSMEAIDIIEAAIEGDPPVVAYLKSNVIKYLLRFQDKNGLEDLRKASWYLDRLISKLDY